MEDTAAQLTWSAMGADPVLIGVGPRSEVVAPNPPAMLHQWGWPTRLLSGLAGGPGAVAIEGLSPSTDYEVWVADPGAPEASRKVVGRVTTLAPPPGRLLSRFAAVTDNHIGQTSFGYGGRLREGPELPQPSASLCLAAALDEARAWGAELVTLRGDLSHKSRREQFETAARIVADGGMPAVGVLGNHDVRRGAQGRAIFASHGIELVDDVASRDVPGLRLVFSHSPIPGDHRGDLPEDRIARIAEHCAGPLPAALVIHHPLDVRDRLNPHPPGVPLAQGLRLAQALRAANPNVVVMAGHRHRTRRYEVGGVSVAELGSTKDYPGTWAGYAVHEGGIRQVVRRIADPAALAWTEATGRALMGGWARWAPGRLRDRCWTVVWDGLS